jgi:outer membrane biosynthesis protein TonB
MAERFSDKLIGLITAIFVYLALIFAIYYAVVVDKPEKKDYGFNVKDAIVVDIDTLVKEKPQPVQKPKPVNQTRQMPAHVVLPSEKPLPKPIEKHAEKPLPALPENEPEPKEEPTAQKQKESRDKMARSAKDLFSTIRTEKYAKAMEEKRKEAAARASRLKKQKAEQARKKRAAKKRARAEARKRARQHAEAQKLLQELDASQATSRHRKKGEEHEFWSYVSDKIMSKWNRTIATQDGLKGYATIRIDNKGHLTYKNLKLSGNSLFDTKLKVFLDNLEYTKFPAYKNGPYIEAVFEFKDQAKGP